MKTLKLTAKDFKTVDGYKEYTGKENLTDFEGNLEFEANLGWMKFKSIKVSGYISIKAGGWIKAGDSIEAGDSIKAGGWIKAGDSIKAGGSIKAGDSIEAGDSIKAGGWIKAGDSIKAGGSIKAGDSIEAGGWIEAGGSIKAGGSIEAGGSIKAGGSIEVVSGGITCGLQLTCKGLLKFKLRLFAGVSPYSWRAGAGNTVTCGKLEGNVVYGNVVETGLPYEPEESSKADTLLEVVIEGVVYVPQAPQPTSRGQNMPIKCVDCRATLPKSKCPKHSDGAMK